MPDNPPRAPGELADEVEAMLKSMRPEDIAAGSCCQPLMGFTGPEWRTILASLRSATGDGGEAMREICARFVEFDRRTELAKECGYMPKWHLHAIELAAAIRALQPRSTKIEGAGE